MSSKVNQPQSQQKSQQGFSAPDKAEEVMPTEMKKPALVIKRDLLPQAPEGHVTIYPVPVNFFLLPTQLADRVGSLSCEENPSLQQIIPYMVVINENNELFTYSRGQASGEEKLKTKLSIGLGGHIDACAPEGVTNHEWFTQEARRELAEEVGILSEDVAITYSGLLFDRQHHKTEDGKTYVGQVHCGLLSFIRVRKSEVTKLEQGVIENGQWLSVPDLQDSLTNSRLEDWSRAALSYWANR
jgi:predicted NUDIX family phosphoesterase